MFKGTGVAVVTPFLKGEVDYNALGRVLTHLIDGGVDYLVMMGTTGEAATLSREERLEIFRYTVEYVDGRVPIVAGFGSNNTLELVRTIEAFDFTGIDAILSVAPFYNRPTQDGLFAHFMAIEKASPVPIILYNVPSRTACNLHANTTLRLAEASKKFIGIKEASGDLRQVMEIIDRKPEDFLVISGDDNITLPLMVMGASGVISVVGNAFPRTFSDMVRAAMASDYATARKLHYQLMHITDLLFIDGSPAGVKAALAIQGICEQEVRLPLITIKEDTYSRLKTLIDQHLKPAQ